MQKFNKGDWVHVAKDLGAGMSHFRADCDAIVIGSYADQFGGDEDDKGSYTLFIKGQGRVSWYKEWQLVLIEANRIDKLEEWDAEEKAEIKQKSDLDWIFDNGADVIKNPHGASLQALASCFGLTNLWGSQGEGITYYANAEATLNFASPFLEYGDKAGWLAQCELLTSGWPVTT